MSFICIKQSGETPFDLAVQNNHSSLIAMMTDYHEKGVKSLNKYSGLAQGDNGKSKTSAPTRPVSIHNFNGIGCFSGSHIKR